ncbi:peptidylprolyl isomerase [Kibdelosporangium banguiense]|uniref:Peptidyl-prolyl cis-trans isomerase n=1 Tax=Kibdelosporangium banguiense TaxID=1365924 RepID=A0ABS4U1F4_9PSEU|nr:FKBP-type peptidyl-prolyl cis-trans isomerase [Kibdelosporangium banguiense]MBP2330054.1 peptidylprolyl isomerase [Kibdelosporangium banguiense]
MRIAGKVTMVTVALVAAATLSACANSEQDSPGTSNRNSAPPPLPITTTATTTSAAKPTSPATYKPGPGECTAEDVKIENAEFGKKPTITLPTTCQPPKGLVIKDLVPGTGPEIKQGSVLEANYLLQTWSDKQIVDNSFDRGQTLSVQGIGSGRVIKGWDQGLLGMKEGGRRLLIIPPDLGYGPQGKPPVKPNETLVFVTDAVKVTG